MSRRCGFTLTCLGDPDVAVYAARLQERVADPDTLLVTF